MLVKYECTVGLEISLLPLSSPDILEKAVSEEVAHDAVRPEY